MKTLIVIFAATILTGCASSYKNLPVYTATVVESQASLRKEFTPSLGGAVAGAAAGGVLGNQMGKGKGRKVATVLGALAGGAAGGAAGGTESMVPVSLIAFRDNTSQQEYRGIVDGQWLVGMAVLYSVTENGKIIIR